MRCRRLGCCLAGPAAHDAASCLLLRALVDHALGITFVHLNCLFVEFAPRARLGLMGPRAMPNFGTAAAPRAGPATWHWQDSGKVVEVWPRRHPGAQFAMLFEALRRSSGVHVYVVGGMLPPRSLTPRGRVVARSRAQVSAHRIAVGIARLPLTGSRRSRPQIQRSGAHPPIG